MKAWQRTLALLVAIGGLHVLMGYVVYNNHLQDVYEFAGQQQSAALFAVAMSILLLPMLLVMAILPRRPLAMRLAAGEGWRARLAGTGYLLASLVPGLLLVFGAVFWAAPHHYLLAAGYLLVLALAAWTYLSDTRRLFPSMFKPAQAIYLSLLAIAAVLLMIDGDHLSGMRPSKEEQARLDARPQGLDQAPIYSLLQASDGVLFASTGGTWFRSADRGILWNPAFPVHAAGIVKLPRTGALIAAISKQGIMRSGDSGKSWQMLLPVDKEEETAGLWISSNGTLFYYGRGRILSSKDEGRTWSKPGVFRDKEGEEVWPRIDTFAAGADCAAYVVSSDDGMFRSRDCGQTWQEFTAPETIKDLLVADDGSLMANFEKSGIMRSTDHGEHWRAARVDPDDAFEVQGFLPAPGLPLHAAIDGHLLRSVDNGATWVPTEYQFTEQVLSIAPGKDGAWFAGTGQGLYRSTDKGASWTKLSEPPKREEPEPRRPYVLSAFGV